MFFRASLGLSLIMVCGSSAFANIITIDCPGAAGTVVEGINNLGQIVGDCDGGPFLYSNGIFSSINVPSSISVFEAFGINDLGQIVGTAEDKPVVDTGGVFSFVDVVGTGYAIDNLGDIAGSYEVFLPPSEFLSYGFIDIAGVVSTIDSGSVLYGTEVLGINDSRQLIVIWGGQWGLYSGGVFYPVNVPGASATLAEGINDYGEIVGVYFDSTNTAGHVFADIGGTFSSFDIPGAAYVWDARGVNDSGEIVGDYLDSNGVQHGFLYTPAVPEPSSITLLASAAGLLGLAVRLQRKRKVVDLK